MGCDYSQAIFENVAFMTKETIFSIEKGREKNYNIL